MIGDGGLIGPGTMKLVERDLLPRPWWRPAPGPACWQSLRCDDEYPADGDDPATDEACITPSGIHCWEGTGTCAHPAVMFHGLAQGRVCTECGVVEHRVIVPFTLSIAESTSLQSAISSELGACPAWQRHLAIRHPEEAMPTEVRTS